MSEHPPTHATNDLPPCPVEAPQCLQKAKELEQVKHELAELSELVRTDPLTTLYNFRHFREVMEIELERTRRTAQPTALIMIDLDHFKNVNDTWGHEAGNLVLKSTAKTMQNCIRQLDVACRYGGEEFAVILPAANSLIAKQVAQRICDTIANKPVMFNGEDISTTASLGIAVLQSNRPCTAEALVERADQALYEAKQNGRNQVCHETLDIEPEVFVSKAEKDALAELFDNSEQP